MRQPATILDGLLAEPAELPPLPQEPLVSVLVANYNYEGYVGTALDSLLEQSYPRFEALVCDDGSSDGSCDVIARYARSDDRIRLLTKPNGGVASALNTAYEAARGEILCLLDADDLFAPRKLEAVVNAFKLKPWGLLVHPLLVVDGEGRGVQRKPALSGFEEGWIAANAVARGGRWTYMEASAVCLRRELAEWSFPIDETRFRSWADAYICTLASLLTPVGYIDEVLAHYRLHGANVSGFSSLSREQANKGMDGVTRVLSGVNERLEKLGIQGLQLDPSKNLIYLESSMLEALFGEERGSVLLRRYSRYAKAAARDDLYSLARKIVAIGFIGSAMLLPRHLRPRWVSAGMTESRLKEAVRRLLGSLRTILGSRRAAQAFRL